MSTLTVGDLRRSTSYYSSNSESIVVPGQKATQKVTKGNLGPQVYLSKAPAVTDVDNGNNQDIFLPEPVYSDADCSKPDDSGLKKALFQSTGVAYLLLSMLDFLYSQTKAMKELTDIQNVIYDALAQFGKTLTNLANQMVTFFNDLAVETREKLLDSLRKEGLWGILFSVVEIVVAIAMIAAAVVAAVASAGTASVLSIATIIAAVAMLVNALPKLGASIDIAINPEHGLGDESYFMQHGLMGIFDVMCGKGAGQTAEYILIAITSLISIAALIKNLVVAGIKAGTAVATAVVEASVESAIAAIRTMVSSLVKTFAAGAESTVMDQVLAALKLLARAVFSLIDTANQLTSFYSTIKGLVDTMQSDSAKRAEQQKDGNKDGSLSGGQALMMGLYAFAVYEAIHQTGLDKKMDEKLGSGWAVVIETALCAIGAFVGSKYLPTLNAAEADIAVTNSAAKKILNVLDKDWIRAMERISTNLNYISSTLQFDMTNDQFWETKKNNLYINERALINLKEQLETIVTQLIKDRTQTELSLSQSIDKVMQGLVDAYSNATINLSAMLNSFTQQNASINSM